MKLAINRAVDVLLGGGVIAYPTEGVFGLGCLPDTPRTLLRLLNIKNRDPAKGLILIAAGPEQFEGFVAADDIARLPEPSPAAPVTWIASPGPKTHALVRGANSGVAIRITTNPVAAAICDAVESPITSTSANLAGKPTVRNKIMLQRAFQHRVDYIVPGDCGPASGPSEIRRLDDQSLLRPGTL
ncbi:MAG: L-threonylcarbamoyladenylate synthase [Gammaproteobacteria bacterium]|nr:L-threonylcarbamoyladenylate synthase [Gammaproteobacteria bacterium]